MSCHQILKLTDLTFFYYQSWLFANYYGWAKWYSNISLMIYLNFSLQNDIYFCWQINDSTFIFVSLLPNYFYYQLYYVQVTKYHLFTPVFFLFNIKTFLVLWFCQMHAAYVKWKLKKPSIYYLNRHLF